MVRYAILGPIELCDGERRVAAGGPRQVALLAVLLVNANRALSSDRLIDTLWGDLGPAGALKRLHVAILRLRRALDLDGVEGESVLRTVSGGYLLAVAAGELDAEVFQTRMREGRRALEAGEPARARDVFGQALGMWRGPALAEVAFEEFAQPEIRRLEELRLAALEARVDCELRLGEHDGLIGELEALVAAHPGREGLAGQLMLALYRCGRQGDALEVFARSRAYLSGELGLEPGPALQALQSDILAQAPALEHVRDEPGAAGLAGAPAAEQADVRNHLPQDMALVDVGQHELPGLARPERVFELRATARESAAGPSASAGPVVLALPRPLHTPAGSPFVGRAAELTRLRERWAGVRSEARSTIVIGGEPGIGKTRLASELAREAHEQDALVLYGRCDEGLAVPYQPFVEALRPYARAAGLDRLRAELGHLAPQLGRLLPELGALGQPIRSDPESERFALFEAVAALFEAMTRERRALLVLDDLHWAANPTLLLLRHLIRSERPLGALVLCTYRDTELDFGRALAQLFADLQRDGSAERVSVGGLDDGAITALVAAALGHPLADRAELVQLLGAQTAGNPFFLRELLADLAEAGTISSAGERTNAGVTTALLQPSEGLRHVIGHRVARLSADAGRALSVASVAGGRFSFVLLERVLGEGSGVLDALDEAVAAGLLTEAGHGDYVFAHALVRQTIYGQLGTARRMRLHRQLGEALETLVDADAHVEALAHHFAQAAADGQGAKAVVYALAAGRHATARLGFEDAAAHYERGLEALTPIGQPQDARRCELLLALGEARWGTGEPDRARQACRQAAELADKLGDASALARAALGAFGPYRAEEAPAMTRPVVDLLQRALAALCDDDSALRARLMGSLAATLAHTDVDHDTTLIARQALQMARRVADKTTLADVLASSLLITHGPDTLHDSLATARELERVADEIGDGRLRARAHRWLLDFLLELGDIDGVERELQALQRLADARRERYVTWLLTVFRANHAHLRGGLEEFEALAHDALAHRFEGRDESAAQIFGVQMFFLRAEQGRLDEIVGAVEGFVAQYPAIASWRCALAFVYARLERRAHARKELDALARADFCDLPRDRLWLLNLAAICEVAVLLGDASRAHLLYELLLPYADRCVVATGLLCRGSASRPLGLLATTLSRHDEAARHFDQALKMNTQIRSPLWIAHTQHDYARMLLIRNSPGDRDEACELVTQALTTADLLGLKVLTDSARRLQLAAQAPAQALPRTA